MYPDAKGINTVTMRFFFCVRTFLSSSVSSEISEASEKKIYNAYLRQLLLLVLRRHSFILQLIHSLQSE